MAKVTERSTLLLELSTDEATFLRDLIGRHVVGHYTTSRRGLGNEVLRALEDAGIRSGPEDSQGVVEFG